MQNVKPLKNRLYVRRIPAPDKTPGGIVIPTHFYNKLRGEMDTRPAHTFRVEVIAVGPDVREVEPGDVVDVWTYASPEDMKNQLYTGQPFGDGLFITDEDLTGAKWVEA